MEMRCRGSPLARVSEVIFAIGHKATDPPARALARGRDGELRPVPCFVMAATEIQREDLALRAHRDPDPNGVIQFRGVSKTYESGDVGLENATFSIPRGEFVFIVGQTGSGKSTIMRLLLKEHEPTGGRIVVAGRDLSEIEDNKVPY